MLGYLCPSGERPFIWPCVWGCLCLLPTSPGLTCLLVPSLWDEDPSGPAPANQALTLRVHRPHVGEASGSPRTLSALGTVPQSSLPYI